MIFNGKGKPFEFLHKTLLQTVDCENIKFYSFTNIKSILIIIGVAITGIAGVAIVPFAFFIQSKSNHLINELRELSKKSAPIMKQATIERLEEIHYKIYVCPDNQNSKKELKKIQVKSLRRYLWRIGLACMVVSFYYFVSNFYFFIEFQAYFKLKPDIIKHLLNSRIHLTEMNFWIKQVITKPLGLDMYTQYPDTLGLSYDYDKELSNSADSLLYSLNALRNAEYKPILGDAILESILEKYNETTPSASYGMIPGIITDIKNAYYLKSLTLAELVVYFPKFNQITNELGAINEKIFKDFIDYSDLFIQSLLKNFIIFSSFTLGSLFFVYFLVYVPFIRKEIEKIMNIKKVTKILANGFEERAHNTNKRD